MNEAQIRLDDCRHAVLNALYLRRQGSHTAETIRTVFLSSHDFTLNEVQVALLDLKRLHYADDAESGMTGAEVVWQISGDGLKFKERGRK